jgi:hypothetical protein
MRLDSLLTERSKLPSNHRDNKILLQRVHIDLAKALWIIDLVPQLAEVKSAIGDVRLVSLLVLRHSVLIELRRILGLMQRRSLFLNLEYEPILFAESDISIWLKYPVLGFDIDIILSGYSNTSEQTPSSSLLSDDFPLEDTNELFLYGTMPIEVFFFGESSNSQQIKYPALMSVVRKRECEHLTMIISSQDGRFKLQIPSDSSSAPTWDDITWLPVITALEVKLPTGFRLQLRCTASDFRKLEGMYHHYGRTLGQFEELANERIIFETDVESAQYHPTSYHPTHFFPTSAVSQCQLRLFQQIEIQQSGTGPRRLHRGYRIAVLTPLSDKTLSILSHDMPPDEVVEFGFLRGENNNPTLRVKLDRDNFTGSLLLGFLDPKERNTLLAHLTGCYVKDNEEVLANVHINNVSINSGLGAPEAVQESDSFQWNNIRVISQKSNGSPAVEHSSPVLSESLRIIVDSPSARITDRLNVDVGELKIRRNVVASGHEIRILREPQKDLTFSLSNLAETNQLPSDLKESMASISTLPSIRTYRFSKIADLHAFQAAITGFSILYDGTPASFTIARRQIMIPVSKEWSSPHTRIQILRRGRIFQLAAFFEGFKNGKCMNFAIKGTDVFERVTKGAQIMLRIVDAKFALPSGGKKDAAFEKGFACLDLLEYPGEHDNITIGFGSHSGESIFEALRFWYTNCW